MASRRTSASATFAPLPPTAMKTFFIHPSLHDLAPPRAGEVTAEHEEQVEQPRVDDALEQPHRPDLVEEVACAVPDDEDRKEDRQQSDEYQQYRLPAAPRLLLDVRGGVLPQTLVAEHQTGDQRRDDQRRHQ